MTVDQLISELARADITVEQLADPGARRMIQSVQRSSRRYLQLRRARRTDRRFLADLTAANIIRAAHIVAAYIPAGQPVQTTIGMIRDLDLQELPRRAALLAGHDWPPHVEQWLTSLDIESLVRKSWDSGPQADLRVPALFMASELLEIDARIDGLADGPHRRGLRRLWSQRLACTHAAFEAFADGADLPEDLHGGVFWWTQPLMAMRVALSALDHAPELHRELEPVVAAHRRALGEPQLDDVPVFFVGDLGFFDVIGLSEWAQPQQTGRTRAMTVYSTIVLVGPGETGNVQRAAARGTLQPTIVHELLHCLPCEPMSPARRDDWRLDGLAWREGGQQVWAEEVCLHARDPQTGLAGGLEHTPAYRGWKTIVRALADEIGQPRLTVARALATAGHGNEIAQVTDWLCGTRDPATVTRVQQHFAQLVRDAHDQRFSAGVVARTDKRARQLIAATRSR